MELDDVNDSTYLIFAGASVLVVVYFKLLSRCAGCRDTLQVLLLIPDELLRRGSELGGHINSVHVGRWLRLWIQPHQTRGSYSQI